MKSLSCWLLALAMVVVADGSLADSDQDRVRRAVESGLILPLRDILTRAQQSHSGQVIEAELEEEAGRIVYEIKILSNDGRIVEIVYDARTGEFVKASGKGGKR